MWTHEVSADTEAAAEAIWHLWTHVETWRDWNADLDSVSIDGPFAPGARISMRTLAGETVDLRVVEVVENEKFVDQADFGEVLIRTTHCIEPGTETARRVVYRMEITGSAADQLGPEIGPQITADFPETIAALIARAEQ
jgi:hypothetical protein